MPIRFASEAWPRPGLAEPRSASIAGCGNTGPLSATEQKGKECHNQDKQAQGASFGGSFLVQGASFGGSFLVPEIDMIFGDGVGASLVRGSYCQLGVGLMRSYIGTAQLKKVLGWA